MKQFKYHLSFAVVMLVVGCNVYGQDKYLSTTFNGNNVDVSYGSNTNRKALWLLMGSPNKDTVITLFDHLGNVAFRFIVPGGECEPTNVSIDSLVKWHQWRMVQLMKGRKGQGGLSYIGTQNEPNLPWQFSDGTFADDYYRNHKWAKISEYWNNLPESARDSLTKITIEQERQWDIINRRYSESPYNIPDSLKPKKKDRKVEVWIPDDTNRTFHNINPVHYNAAPEIDTNVLKTDALLRMFPDTNAIRQRAVDEYKEANKAPWWMYGIISLMGCGFVMLGGYIARKS